MTDAPAPELTLPPTPPEPLRRRSLLVPWLLTLLSLAAAIALIPWTMQDACSGRALLMIPASGVLAILAIIATIVQQARSPKGAPSGAGPVLIYCLTGLLLCWAPMSLFMAVMASDSC